MFRATIDDENVLMYVYVDDGQIVCKNSEIINKLLKRIGREFSITLDAPTYRVGMEIARPHQTVSIKLHQRFYIENMVKPFG